MSPLIRNLLLSAVLIALPVTGFVLVAPKSPPPVAALHGAPLGDLGAYRAITADTLTIVQAGDLAGAAHRITDLERWWDDSAPTLRKSDPAAWAEVDDAADAVFAALRAQAPDAANATAALTHLGAVLSDPLAGVAVVAGAPQLIAGIAVTDATGHALPCEEMTGALRKALAGVATPSAEVLDLQTRALERCTADDDSHADAFAAQALALVNG